MFKRLSILSGSLLLFSTGFAAPLIDQVRSDPAEIQVHKPTKVVFTAHVTTDAQHIPTKVHLLRLQWSGDERETSRMWDDGTHGDVTAKDGVYTCVLKLKEPTMGLLSFRVEVFYHGSHDPMRSQPIFINVAGGP